MLRSRLAVIHVRYIKAIRWVLCRDVSHFPRKVTFVAMTSLNPK